MPFGVPGAIGPHQDSAVGQKPYCCSNTLPGAGFLTGSFPQFLAWSYPQVLGKPVWNCPSEVAASLGHAQSPHCRHLSPVTLQRVGSQLLVLIGRRKRGCSPWHELGDVPEKGQLHWPSKSFLFLNSTSRYIFFHLCPHFHKKSQCNFHANQMRACKIRFLQDVGECITLTPGDLWLCQWHTLFKSMQMKTLPTPQANTWLFPCCSHGAGNVRWVKS